MFEEINKLLKQVETIKQSQEDRLSKASLEIENITDEKTKEFLKNSLSLAKKGELNAEGFIAQAKNYIDVANKS